MVKGNVWMGGWYVTEMRCAGWGEGGGLWGTKEAAPPPPTASTPRSHPPPNRR